MTEQEALVTLNAIPGVGNATIQKIKEHFGSAHRALNLNLKEFLLTSGFAESLAEKIFDFPRDSFLRNEYNLVAQYGVEILTLDDPNYPELLRHVPGAPVVLYVKGEVPISAHVGVAIVGSRRASLYGLKTARMLSCRLAELGIVIVSGLARGIDAVAHESSLQVKGRTVAVLGCGLGQIYPPEHKDLAERIVASGALISEFPMMMPPLGMNFPRRNRIISGLSSGVIVVEAAIRSGAMITTAFALEQGREVFAVPGPVGHPNSQGVNRLIRQGAKLVTCVEDVLEELAPQLREMLAIVPSSEDVKANRPKNEFTVEELAVLEYIGEQKIHLDELSVKCGKDREAIGLALLNFEKKGEVRRFPGGFYTRQRS